jgi:hypothetical protein
VDANARIGGEAFDFHSPADLQFSEKINVPAVLLG